MGGEMKLKIKLLCFSIFLLFIWGCGGTRQNFNINYVPEKLRSPPLSTVSPKSFFIRIEDKRPDNEIGFVGYHYGIDGKQKYTSNFPPSEIIYSSLIKTLKESGHQTIIDEKSNSIDIVLSIQLNKFLQDYRFKDMQGNATSILLGHINADIAMINGINNQELFKKNVNTIDTQPFIWNVQKTYEEAYSKHIKQFFDDVFLDFELIGFLKKM